MFVRFGMVDIVKSGLEKKELVVNINEIKSVRLAEGEGLIHKSERDIKEDRMIFDVFFNGPKDNLFFSCSLVLPSRLEYRIIGWTHDFLCRVKERNGAGLYEKYIYEQVGVQRAVYEERK